MTATVSVPGVLSERELHELTLYKWRYELEACGFAPKEVRRIVFVAWLYVSGRIPS